MARSLQRTIQRECSYTGIGIHTGQQVTVTFKPAPVDHGITFVRVDMPETPEVDEKLNERMKDSLSRYTGRYRNMSGLTEISARGGKLYMEIQPTGISAALPKSPLKPVCPWARSNRGYDWRWTDCAMQ